LLGVFRDQLPFGEVPIKLYLQSRTQKEPGERDALGERTSGDSETWGRSPDLPDLAEG
jgi:hypothetical protein